MAVFEDYWQQLADGAQGTIPEESIEPLVDPRIRVERVPFSWPALEPDLTGDEGDLAGVLVEETGGGAYQARVRVGAHTFLADEPASLGGLGSGPSPFELVSAGLGACSVMTMRMYAERKGWPLERATVRVVHAKRRDQTPADVFKRAITLEGPLDEAQRARLLEMADRCPVDLMLVRGAEVETELLPAA